MSADTRLQFRNRSSDAGREATTWNLADTEHVTNQLERKIHGITSNTLKRIKEEFSIRLIEFEAWWETFGIQSRRGTIEPPEIHFGYQKMHLVSHISESIWRMGLGDNFTTDISEWLHIANMKEAYRASNKVNYIRQMLKHNNRCTHLYCMEETLSYLALQGLYDIDFAKFVILLSASDKQRSIHRAHLLCLQTIQHEPFIWPVSQQVYHLREPHVCRVCLSIKLTSLRDASEDFGIPNFQQLFTMQSEEDLGHEDCGLVLGYDLNVLIDSIIIKLQNGLLYYCQPFHNPTSVERPGLDCMVKYTNANQGMMPAAHKIWVQYTQSEENDLDNTFEGRNPSFPVFYFRLTPPNLIVQFQERLPAEEAISISSKWCKKTQQCVLRRRAQEYGVVIRTKQKDHHGWADCVYGFNRVVKQMNKMQNVPIGAVVGMMHLLWEKAASGGIDGVWLVNNTVDLDIYWTVY